MGRSGEDSVEAGSFSYQKILQKLPSMDANQLQTALSTAIAAEDYTLAAKIRDRLAEQLYDGRPPVMDWHSSPIPEWLVDRVERLGFRYPTEIQRRALPVLVSGADAVLQSETGSGKTMAFLVPCLAQLDYPPVRYPEDLLGPQLLVVVPTFELGVQVCMLIYKLFGGNVSSGIPGDGANMYTYFGPRGIKVRGILNDEEVIMARLGGYLSNVHVLVATPSQLVTTVGLGDELANILDHLKAVVVDEVDACFQENREDMEQVLGTACQAKGTGVKPQVVLVGATVTPGEVEMCGKGGWMKDPVVVRVGKERWEVPRGLRHRYVVCPAEKRLSTLTRMLRKDLEVGDRDGAPARVMVFTDDEEQARAVATPLRNALWSQHRLSVLLPSGAEPIKALHAFRDQQSTLLICPGTSSRGLDLPAVSHVYNLGAPRDARQYLHRAGRAGRIGSTTGGLVTSIVTPEELPLLQEQAASLGVDLVQEDSQEQLLDTNNDPDTLRKGLEDLYNLM